MKPMKMPTNSEVEVIVRDANGNLKAKRHIKNKNGKITKEEINYV